MDGNVIHIPDQCDDCWFNFWDNFTQSQWCGLLCRHVTKKECNYEKVTIK